MSDIIINLNLTSIEKETLKVFLQLKQSNAPLMLVGAEELSQILTENIHDISRPRAYAILSKLEEKGFLQKIKRKGFTLTDKGLQVLKELQHRIKILETYFYKELNMPLESDEPFTSASKEASRLVLHVSFEFIEILCEQLENPRTCPHDIEIPHHSKHPEPEDLIKQYKKEK